MKNKKDGRLGVVVSVGDDGNPEVKYEGDKGPHPEDGSDCEIIGQADGVFRVFFLHFSVGVCVAVCCVSNQGG